MTLDPYRTLGLEPGASTAEVKRAYRRLAKAFHPDSAGEAALPRFLAIHEAYEAIKTGRPMGATRAGRGPANPPPALPASRAVARRSGTGEGGARAGANRARQPDAGAAGGTAADVRERRRGRRGAGSDRAGTLRRPRARAASRRGGTSQGDARVDLVRRGSRSRDDATWSGAAWYGPSSGEYWIINPREYADPRKHGPEYQSRARRMAAEAALGHDRGRGRRVAATPVEETAPTRTEPPRHFETTGRRRRRRVVVGRAPSAPPTRTATRARARPSRRAPVRPARPARPMPSTRRSHRRVGRGPHPRGAQRPAVRPLGEPARDLARRPGRRPGPSPRDRARRVAADRARGRGRDRRGHRLQRLLPPRAAARSRSCRGSPRPGSSGCCSSFRRSPGSSPAAPSRVLLALVPVTAFLLVVGGAGAPEAGFALAFLLGVAWLLGVPARSWRRVVGACRITRGGRREPHARGPPPPDLATSRAPRRSTCSRFGSWPATGPGSPPRRSRGSSASARRRRARCSGGSPATAW